MGGEICLMKTWIELEERTDEASILEKQVINERFQELYGRLNCLLGNILMN